MAGLSVLAGIVFPLPVGATDEPESLVEVGSPDELFPDDVEPLGLLCELLLLAGFVVVAGLLAELLVGFVDDLPDKLADDLAAVLLLAAGFVGITLPTADELSVPVVVVGSLDSLDELMVGFVAELVVAAGFVVGVFVAVAGLVGCTADGFAAGEVCELFVGFVVGLFVVPLLPAFALTVGAAGLGTVLLTAAVLLSVTILSCARVPWLLFITIPAVPLGVFISITL